MSDLPTEPNVNTDQTDQSEAPFRDLFWRKLRLGVLAGIVGGLVFGASMLQTGTLPTIAGIVRADSAFVGFVVHMVVAVIVGGVFGLLLLYQRPGVGETLFWGLSYGTFWWFLGPLTLLPLFLGQGLNWNLVAAQQAFASFVGHVIYGASTALTLLVVERWRHHDAPHLHPWPLLGGAVAGVLAAWILGGAFAAQNGFAALVGVAEQGGTMLRLLFGAVLGLTFALLYPQPSERAGVGLVRGTVYGFLGWLVGVLSIIPLIRQGRLAWTLTEAQERVGALLGLLLLGALTALLYRWIVGASRALFGAEVRGREAEGVGTQGLRAIARGVPAGLVGGVLFTVVMVQLDLLPNVAGLVGSEDRLIGLAVHLAVATLIGMSYGVLFRAQSVEIGSALGWGVSYGFFWWLLGALTLLPALLGSGPTWSAAAAADAFGSLVGHLAYGAGLGVTFYLLEIRYSPWWISHREYRRQKAEQHKREVLTAAPALWGQMVVIALTLPLLLGRV
ncbi:MAG: hypothetical protein U5L04_08220 [Trueperaceae bacterium]|nr:hypothetical protein [Trueperaceae bacterium]